MNFTNFTVDANLRQAVEQFSWDDRNSVRYIPVNEMQLLITEISDRIIRASNIQPLLDKLANKSLSLAETCYLVVQDLDSKSTTPTTLIRIQQATSDEKSILNQSFQLLNQFFKILSVPGYLDQVQPNDLKAITLLFGIKRISELAVQQFPPDQIQDFERGLAQLITLRSKFDTISVPATLSGFLEEIDECIQRSQDTLATLMIPTANDA